MEGQRRFAVGADKILFKKSKDGNRVQIVLSGRNGVDGKSVKNRAHAARESEDVLDGLPGHDGKAGGMAAI